jgi:hypothetical protein
MICGFGMGGRCWRTAAFRNLCLGDDVFGCLERMYGVGSLDGPAAIPNKSFDLVLLHCIYSIDASSAPLNPLASRQSLPKAASAACSAT